MIEVICSTLSQVHDEFSEPNDTFILGWALC